MTTTKYTLFNVNTKEIEKMTVEEIIENINRDRSEHWIPYDLTDWREGLEAFTEYTLLEAGSLFQ